MLVSRRDGRNLSAAVLRLVTSLCNGGSEEGSRARISGGGWGSDAKEDSMTGAGA